MRRPTVPRSVVDSILAKHRGRCAYCERKASGVDHVIPWCVSKDDSPENLVACCQQCNGWASSKRFENFEAKKAYLHKRIDAIKRMKLWYPHDQLRTVLEMMSVDFRDVAKKANMHWQHFEDVLAGFRPASTELSRALLKHWGLHFKPEDFEEYGI